MKSFFTVSNGGLFSSAAKKAFILVLFMAFSLFVFAIDWPVSEGTLIANFGSNDGGAPVLGNSFAVSGSIYPAELGELIFFHDPENPASRFPSPMGSWTALDHGDNLVGLYSRFEDRRGVPFPTMVERGTVLASAGRSGWAEAEGFYFAFFDRRERRWINPSIIISALEDPQPPVIRQVELRNAAGSSFNPASVRSIPQGLYSIFVDTVDTVTAGGYSLAPNRIICTINGVEAGGISFETLISKEGERMVYRNGIIPASRVYDPRGFGLGEVRFSRGQATLVVEARDMADNSRSVSYRLAIE